MTNEEKKRIADMVKGYICSYCDCKYNHILKALDRIDKDAVVAEIEKRIKNLYPKGGQGMVVTKILKDHYEDLLSFINTLEVKDVDFERELSKYATKIKPKFHKDEWIVHHGTENIYQVVAVIDNQYQLKYGDTYTIQKCADVDRCARLWDITKDAKDGDVLEFGDHGRLVTGILSFVNKTTGKVDVSCLLEGNKFKVGVFYNLDTVKPHPATKEQRDLLFQKMKEAGYEWDSEKKELIRKK